MASMSLWSKITIHPCAKLSLLSSGMNFNLERWVEACIDFIGLHRLAGEQQDGHPPSLEQVKHC